PDGTIGQDRDRDTQATMVEDKGTPLACGGAKGSQGDEGFGHSGHFPLACVEIDPLLLKMLQSLIHLPQSHITTLAARKARYNTRRKPCEVLMPGRISSKIRSDQKHDQF